MTKEELLEGAKSLPIDQRIDLVMDLWSAIDAEDQPLTDDLRQELDRRIASDNANPRPAEDWAR